MKKYYLYHIKGIKWGCTTNLKRRLRQQGYTLNDTCEVIEETNIDIAAELEKNLNIRDGYKWNDSHDYRVILKAGEKALQTDYIRYTHTFTENESKLGGHTTGIKKGEKQQRARRNNVAKLNVYQTCPHCGIHTRGAAYFRYHGDKCKLNI